MAERAEADVSQGPADSAKAKVASNAEKREISLPMLDVHAPHEVPHTWKGFFIHIATIVIGLPSGSVAEERGRTNVVS